MNIFWTLVIEMISFGLFIYFFGKVLWKPLMQAMEARRRRISEGLAAAERGQRELEDSVNKAEERMAEARSEAHELLANAQRQANETLERARADARSEGERIVSAAREEVDQTVAQAKDQLRREVGELAVDGAERILKREIDTKAHNDIIDDLVAEIR